MMSYDNIFRSNTRVLEPAMRFERLMAGMIDGALYGTPALLATHYMGLLEIPTRGESASITSVAVVSAFSWLFFLVINFHLLMKRGQSVGKLVMGIKIVNLDDELTNIWKLILLRQLPMFLLNPIPWLGKALTLIDVSFVFGQSRRCVHDLMAGTKVVKN